MKIHLITNLFHPDELAGAALYTDFANRFKEAGHDLRVTAAFSYYPAWKLRPEDVGVAHRDESHNGIPVRRCSMFIPAKPRGLTRLYSDFSFLVSLVRQGRIRNWTPDVVVTACPMLSQCLAQRFLYRGQNVKRLLIVQDFVVDAALELGILKMPGLGGMLRNMERYALRSADVLTTISPEMLSKLEKRIGVGRPLHYIPNWIHKDLEDEVRLQDETQPLPRENQTLFYSGNMGIKQGLPAFLTDFQSADTTWKLRLQGNGPEAERIRPMTGNGKITLGGVEDNAAYVTRLRQTGACLVTQQAGVSANFLPSKLLPALATGTPVLAVAEADTPLAREITSAGYGAVVNPGDVAGLKAALKTMEEPSSIQAMSAKARERAVFYQREKVLSQFDTLLQGLVAA